MFGGYLQKLLEEETPEIGVKELYKRSGEWCIRNGDTLAGLKYLNKAREYDLILDEFEKSAGITLIMDSSPKYILELFEQIPEEAKRRHPIGYLAYAGFFVTNVDRDAGSRLLSELERYYEGDSGLTSGMLRRVHGEIELIRAYIAFNNAPLMLERFKKAHALLGGRSHIANERKIITFGSPHSLYLYYRETGGFLQAKELVQDMFQYYTEMAGGCGRGFDDLLEAEYCLETGDLDRAELNARKAVHKATELNQTSVLICSVFTIARAFAARGKFDKALALMGELKEEVEAAGGPILSSAFDVSFGYIGGITGREDSFSQWLGEGDLAQSEILYQGMGFNYIAYGKHLLLKGDFISLEVLCEQMQQVFSPFHNILGYLHAHILSAVARHRLYGMDRAKESLLSALEIGKADGVVLPFAEYGAHILDILKALQQTGGKDEYLDFVLKNTARYAENLKSFQAHKEARPALTKREREILMLVTEGRSNQEIAAALFLAEVTVRKNITAIYRKLNVTGRAAAVRKALELKIL
ncbi:MAG: LuxR C-terminal-related transcriptional regulator [Clostridia bacterium]|nr:LuxR C-terminal-related transcriptional regulator [Clostridia bacterium]